MSQRSAGILFFRRDPEGLSVLLVHPGGPYWRRRDVGAWQIPKGGIEEDEEDAAAARREAEEELGIAASGRMLDLGEVRQAGGKRVRAFAVEQDIDVTSVRSNSFALEWPPRSGRMQDFPEVDEARWLPLKQARAVMLPSQLPLLDTLERIVADG
ncbi:MAG: hydrolase [Sphingomonas bacterium]|nr:NUDIX domain-containing protein [Sphingomonas bacterium]MDB5689153.1 hydrolase [Sphingomonas bacterium]